MTKENKFFGKDWTKGDIKFPNEIWSYMMNRKYPS